MLKLKKIEEMLNRENNDFYRYTCYRSANKQVLNVKGCVVGTLNSNFGYYDDIIPSFNFKPEWKFLEDDPRINIERCDVCCGCGDW